MKANTTNLKKALKACAAAHNVKFCDWSDEGQLGLTSDNVPVVADVRMICEAFYGTSCMVDTDWGCTTVWKDNVVMQSDVDELLLSLALPYGTKLN